MAKFNFRIENKTYNESDKFEIEKKYDYPRYYVEHCGFINEFKKEFDRCYKINEEYKKSNLGMAHKILTNHSYNSKEKQKVKENTIEVDVTVQKGKKTKTFTETKVNDDLVNYFAIKSNLKDYGKHLRNYKVHRDHDVGEVLGFSTKSEYKNHDEYKNIRKLLKNTRSAINLLENSDLNSNEQKLAEEWLKFLNTNIPVEGELGVYAVLYGKFIEDLPEFKKEDIKKIDTFDKELNNKLNELVKDDVEELSI